MPRTGSDTCGTSRRLVCAAVSRAGCAGPISTSRHAQPISIDITRVVVDGEVVESGTKPETSTRVLPLTPELMAALRAATRMQAVEQLGAGPANERSGYAGLAGRYCGAKVMSQESELSPQSRRAGLRTARTEGRAHLLVSRSRLLLGLLSVRPFLRPLCRIFGVSVRVPGVFAGVRW